MYIIMLGAPGTGKGTIGAEICKHFNLKHIATGDMFRDEIKRQTELGIRAQEFMGEGKLVPDEITIEMLKNRIKDKNILNFIKYGIAYPAFGGSRYHRYHFYQIDFYSFDLQLPGLSGGKILIPESFVHYNQIHPET